jgi:anti-sigma regulatory factor (Ser/Thr protein kinase)
LVDVTELAASELVANAVEHGAGAMVGVRLERSGGRVTIRVKDGNPRSMPVMPEPEAVEDDESGRGLAIVTGLSDQWGAYLCADGQSKVVWAVMADEQ